MSHSRNTLREQWPLIHYLPLSHLVQGRGWKMHIAISFFRSVTSSPCPPRDSRKGWVWPTGKDFCASGVEIPGLRRPNSFVQQYQRDPSFTTRLSEVRSALRQVLPALWCPTCRFCRARRTKRCYISECQQLLSVLVKVKSSGASFVANLRS